MNTKHTHQSHYGGGNDGVVKTYHSEENIFYEKGSELEDWQLKHTGGWISLVLSYLVILQG